MLALFPAPYPDELLYSVCARYHRRSGNASHKATVEDLFGSACARAVTDLPNRLEILSGRLPPGTLNTPERLIDQNTLLPLYRPFLPPRRARMLTDWMKGSNKGGSIHLAIGAMASGIPTPRLLRFCLVCIAADEDEHGEPYWHRSHQVASVRMCHKHHVWLRESEVPAASPGNVHEFQRVPEAAGGCVSPPEDRNSLHHRRIAEAAAWLLHHPCTPPAGLSALHGKYIHHLRRLDLANHSGRVRQREFLHGVVNHFGEEFLAQIHCPVVQEGEWNWLSALVRKPRKTTHPLRHILLIHFLGADLEEFLLGGVPENRPFGRGPWPCLNPVAPHFRQAVICRCTITRNSESGAPVGNFHCPCGFSYARTGPDREPEDRFRRGRILALGPVWERELLNLMGEGRGLRATARALGVDENTVTRHLARLTAHQPQHVPDEEGTVRRDGRRQRWLAAMVDNPDLGRKQLRTLCNADYHWLRRNDLQWLCHHLPPGKSHPETGRRRIDWARRDSEISSRIFPMARELRESSPRPVRVTTCAIGRKVGFLALLQREIEKLPSTKACLERVLESREDFAVRRVRWAAREILRRGEPLQAWRIVREARLRPGYPAGVQAEIDRILSFERGTGV